MTVPRNFRAAGAAVLLAACAATAQIPAGTTADQVRIEKIQLLDFQTDRVGFAVTPSIVPTQEVRIQTITFYGMSLNHVPVFIPPVSEEMQLRPGIRAAPRRPMQVIVYLRDLTTLQPLIELVRGGRVKIEGNALVEAKLDLLPSMLLLRRTANAPIRIDSDLPLDIPGGSLLREQALRILNIAESGRSLAAKSVLSRLGADETQRNLHERFGSSLMLAVSRYELADSNHNRYPVEKMGVAFRIGDKRFLILRELTEPWRFDAAIVLKLRRKELTMVEDSFDLMLWPAGSVYAGLNGAPVESNAVSRRRHDFEIVPSPEERKELMVATENGQRATLVRTIPRASPSNLALLDFKDAPKAGPPIAEIDRRPNASGYGALIAFRFPAGHYTHTVRPEIVRLSARVVGGRLVLDDPIDSSALGSPLISEDGLAGILQDETSGIGYTAAAAALRLSPEPK